MLTKLIVISSQYKQIADHIIHLKLICQYYLSFLKNQCPSLRRLCTNWGV